MTQLYWILRYAYASNVLLSSRRLRLCAGLSSQDLDRGVGLRLLRAITSRSWTLSDLMPVVTGK